MKKIFEATMPELLDQAQNADPYAHRENSSRWLDRLSCTTQLLKDGFSREVMENFWKDDVLSIQFQVSNNSRINLVQIELFNILKYLQNIIIKNNYLLTVHAIMQAISQSTQQESVKYSCTCQDFKNRLSVKAFNDGSLASNYTPPESETFTQRNIGPICKQITAVFLNKMWRKELAEILFDYIQKCRDNPNFQYTYEHYIFPKLYGLSIGETSLYLTGKKSHNLGVLDRENLFDALGNRKQDFTGV